MKFTVNSRAFLDLLTKMQVLVESKGAVIPNIRFSRKHDNLIIEYVGLETYASGEVILESHEDWEEGDYVLTQASTITKLSTDFSSYTFSLDKTGKIITISADNNKYSIKLSTFSNDTVFLSLPHNKINVTLKKEVAQQIGAFLKFAPKFVYKNDTDINLQFTIVRMTVKKEDDDWILQLIVCDSRNLICKKISLGNDFNGIETKVFIPIVFFFRWNTLNFTGDLELGIDNKTGRVTLQDFTKTTITHNTVSDNGFIDLEEFVDNTYKNIKEQSGLRAKIDAKALKRNIEYTVAFENAQQPFYFNFEDENNLAIIMVGEKTGGKKHQRIITSDTTPNPIIKLFKTGSVKLQYEPFIKTLDTVKELTHNENVYMCGLNNNILIYNKDRTVLSICAGLQV